MTDQEIARALEIMIREDAKRPVAEQIRDLIESGLIDEHGRVYSENLALVQDLLNEKGFGGIIASHKGHVPGGAVRLREIHEEGPRAEGPYDKIRRIIKGARDTKGLWVSLESAGYCKKSRELVIRQIQVMRLPAWLSGEW